MANYFLTNKAIEDLSKIWNYTYNLWSENQADKYYELIIDTCQQIANDPHIAKNYSEISNEIVGLRAGQHIIFYRISTSTAIEILRILHGRMDLKNKFDE